MIRKIMMVLTLIITLNFVSCGSSSDEAKELLQKILQFIGIPQSIVVQVCQDNNNDGICNINESKTKVTINKGDLVDDILEKISLTEDGEYFIETYNPELPILVELQDVAKVNFDEGKFTLVFNGFKSKEDDNETKEVSILESMVDANALDKTIADTFRTLNNQESQEKYYVALLDTSKKNINILRTQGLDSQDTVKAIIKEMGEESRVNQGQVDKINACDTNQTCVDIEIKLLSDELFITEAEANEIKPKEILESDYFITRWKTDNEGVSDNNQIHIPTNTEYTYKYDVDWGDGTTTEAITGDTTHTYEASGTYIVKISRNFPHIYNISEESDSGKLLSVEQWGTNNWLSMKDAFLECENMVINASDKPQLSSVTDMSGMFSDASSLNQDISTWDVANVTDMNAMFAGATNFNQDIGTWNITNVTDISSMFILATNFNQDISAWDVANVTDMNNMFAHATAFNQDIGAWNFEKVTSMASMFAAVALSTANYDALLISLHNQSLQQNVSFDGGNSKYSTDAEGPRNLLQTTFNWSITDGGVQ